MTMRKMNKKHEPFGGDFEMFFNQHYLQNANHCPSKRFKGLILVTNTENMYFIFELGDPPARAHPSCHSYLLSNYCPMNLSYTNMFHHYMYLEVEDRKNANPFVGHVLSAECNPYYYVKEPSSAVQPKEKDVEKVGAALGEGTCIKFTVEKSH